MATALAILNAILFALLGGLHLYWMLGDRRGLAQAIPTNPDGGERIMNPGPVTCLAIALGLLGFAAYHVSLAIGFMQGQPFGNANQWVIWVISGIFLLRAVGDFRYVGYFKQVKNTAFGRMDTRWYAPLCLYLGVSSLCIALSH